MASYEMGVTMSPDAPKLNAEIPLPTAGVVRVYAQGDPKECGRKTVFLTCHDYGTNHRNFYAFVDHPCMREVRERSVFLHVCLPGQDDNAQSLPDTYRYPSLDQIGSELIAVLNHYEVRSVVAIGEGAGANIICRFAVANPNQCLGVVLVHCTSKTVGFMGFVKDKLLKRRMSTHGMDDAVSGYLMEHKFGPYVDRNSDHVKTYVHDLQAKINPTNLALYMGAYANRTDLSSILAAKPNFDTLLVVGSKVPDAQETVSMLTSMSKAHTTMLIVDDVYDVMSEAPEKFAQSLILFCKGLGVLTGVAVPGMERRRTLITSASMEEADRPRRLSLAANALSHSPTGEM